MSEEQQVNNNCEDKTWGVLDNLMGWVQLIIINSIIAVLLTIVTDNALWRNFVFSQFIGFSIVTSLTLVLRFRKLNSPDVWVYVIGIPLGSIIGIAISLFATGSYRNYDAESGMYEALRGLMFSIVIGSSLAYYFLQRSRNLQERAQLAEQLAENANKERQLSQAQLAVLQAQIEPHFLFNTLSNVVGLIDNDSASAKRMLESLTTYLRATLSITRQPKTTVQQEVDLLEAFLSIFKIRMGERLHYTVSVQSSCRNMSLPPLLLQPLVENAIKHGLEPLVSGGEIHISIKSQSGELVCEVLDTGRGLNPADLDASTTVGEGVGLNNVRERLMSLYGEESRLKIVENSDSGVKASITIPLSALD